MTISLQIQQILESGGNRHLPLRSDPSHRFRQSVAVLPHEELAHYSGRTASSRVAVNQHGRMIRSQVLQETNGPQKLFRAISATIYQLNDLNALNASLLSSYPRHAAIEAQHRANTRNLK